MCWNIYFILTGIYFNIIFINILLVFRFLKRDRVLIEGYDFVFFIVLFGRFGSL